MAPMCAPFGAWVVDEVGLGAALVGAEEVWMEGLKWH